MGTEYTVYSSEGVSQENFFLERNKYYVVCTEGKRSGSRRVRDYSRPRRHRRNCYHASAWTQDRQYFQHNLQLPTVTRSLEQKEVLSFDRASFYSILMYCHFCTFVEKSPLDLRRYSG